MKPNYEYFCGLLLKHSGQELHEDKAYLVETRLCAIAGRLQLPSVDALLTKLQFGHDPVLIKECVEAMTTHESSFFRDTQPFVQLADVVLPKVFEEKASSKSLRIWSAACSTGQEPYSIAMTLEEHEYSLHDWYLEIFATDMVANSVDYARKGIYSEFEIGRGLKPAQRDRWFKKVAGGYQVSPALHKHVHFHIHNLLDPVIEHGPFDIVFCRNVLIYLTREKKIEVLNRIGSVLAHDGLLILGSAETVIGLSDDFESYTGQRGLFQKRVTIANGSL